MSLDAELEQYLKAIESADAEKSTQVAQPVPEAPQGAEFKHGPSPPFLSELKQRARLPVITSHVVVTVPGLKPARVAQLAAHILSRRGLKKHLKVIGGACDYVDIAVAYSYRKAHHNKCTDIMISVYLHTAEILAVDYDDLRRVLERRLGTIAFYKHPNITSTPEL